MHIYDHEEPKSTKTHTINMHANITRHTRRAPPLRRPDRLSRLCASKGWNVMKDSVGLFERYLFICIQVSLDMFQPT